MADSISGRIYGPQYKLIGKNYVTADLFAKVTGKSKYAEDFRAEGMLFCKLLLSPLPHARVKHIDASEALALPGVRFCASRLLASSEWRLRAPSMTDATTGRTG
jgi:CO/xanthine dehydrogenase Mo-binding subunit